MPHRPLPPCAVRTCSGRATNGRYCQGHAHLNKRNRKPDNRPSASARGYDRAWRRVRGAFLKKHPTCALCGEVAEEVDHIIPIADGGERLKHSNLQALCKTHHSQKTAYLDGGFGRDRGGGI